MGSVRIVRTKAFGQVSPSDGDRSDRTCLYTGSPSGPNGLPVGVKGKKEKLSGRSKQKKALPPWPPVKFQFAIPIEELPDGSLRREGTTAPAETQGELFGTSRRPSVARAPTRRQTTVPPTPRQRADGCDAATVQIEQSPTAGQPAREGQKLTIMVPDGIPDPSGQQPEAKRK